MTSALCEWLFRVKLFTLFISRCQHLWIVITAQSVQRDHSYPNACSSWTRSVGTANVLDQEAVAWNVWPSVRCARSQKFPQCWRNPGRFKIFPLALINNVAKDLWHISSEICIEMTEAMVSFPAYVGRKGLSMWQRWSGRYSGIQRTTQCSAYLEGLKGGWNTTTQPRIWDSKWGILSPPWLQLQYSSYPLSRVLNPSTLNVVYAFFLTESPD